jgi:hypothetical protein
MSSTAKTARPCPADHTSDQLTSRRTLTTFGPSTVGKSNRVTWAMPYLFGKGILDQSTPPFPLDSLGDPLEDDL